MKRILRFGFFSGVAGGCAMALFSFFVARGPIEDALAYEESLAHSHDGASAQDEMFSRGVQEVGGLVGIMIFAAALGLIFAIVLAALAPRMGRISPMIASAGLGVVGFWTVVIVPFLKYPANPPGVGNSENINQRTLLYFTLLAASILLTVAVFRIQASLQRSQVRRAWTGVALYCVGLGAILLVFPPADAVSAPADLVWNFRLASLGGLAVAWVVMALTLGTLLTSNVMARPETATATDLSV